MRKLRDNLRNLRLVNEKLVSFTTKVRSNLLYNTKILISRLIIMLTRLNNTLIGSVTMLLKRTIPPYYIRVRKVQVRLMISLNRMLLRFVRLRTLRISPEILLAIYGTNLRTRMRIKMQSNDNNDARYLRNRIGNLRAINTRLRTLRIYKDLSKILKIKRLTMTTYVTRIGSSDTHLTFNLDTRLLYRVTLRRDHSLHANINRRKRNRRRRAKTRIRLATTRTLRNTNRSLLRRLLLNTRLTITMGLSFRVTINNLYRVSNGLLRKGGTKITFKLYVARNRNRITREYGLILANYYNAYYDTNKYYTKDDQDKYAKATTNYRDAYDYRYAERLRRVTAESLFRGLLPPYFENTFLPCALTGFLIAPMCDVFVTHWSWRGVRVHAETGLRRLHGISLYVAGGLVHFS